MSSYRMAAPRLLDDDSALLDEARRDVQRTNDNRRLRSIARILDWNEPTTTTSRSEDRSEDTGGGFSIYYFANTSAPWVFLLVILAPFLILFAAQLILMPCAALVRRRIERRLYGKPDHKIGASVSLLGFALGALIATFLGDGAQLAGWITCGLGILISAIAAYRRREWSTDYKPWLDAPVA